jgi:uncharacterized protein YbaR (Trm112 family)
MMTQTTSHTKLDPKLLEILACPACDIRPPVHLSDDGSTLNCDLCGRRYPILADGIPVMLIDQATLPTEQNATLSDGTTN